MKQTSLLPFNQKIKLKLQDISKAWYFVISIIFIYIILGVIDFTKALESLQFSASVFIKIIPVFVLVFALMAITNYFVTPKKLAGWLNKKHGWLIAIVAGIISTGPIYMWYPMLQDLQKQGVKNGLIATFLYNRAIKPAHLPLIIIYFGLAFTVVLTIVMAVLSVIQGWLVEKIVDYF
ncbi:hypothetical protein HN924_02570 [Candidatus Woesearchaeota archaeon]|jgi:uncharacterized membrane protein YraQ (UPF0718 family)|nr:hypothetical protein [Candidatus Woesearchaeota archaeon]MBT7062827.1 hypothetical protein [Candidatus Woesearchaeota archaeon]MBT7402279.1 hypothetical protein [Candidatus Woesearchaeota archaeon]